MPHPDPPSSRPIDDLRDAGLPPGLSGAPVVASPTMSLVELERTADGDAVTFRHAREDSFGQMVVLGGSTFAFMVFVVSIMPLMNMTRVGNVLWTIVGLVVLVGIGLATQTRVRETRVRLDAVGVSIEQGTVVDQESVAIEWAELGGVELEPVDPKDGRKGMKLRLLPRRADPVDALADVALGDLNEVRRAIADGLHAHRAGGRPGA